MVLIPLVFPTYSVIMLPVFPPLPADTLYVGLGPGAEGMFIAFGLVSVLLSFAALSDHLRQVGQYYIHLRNLRFYLPWGSLPLPSSGQVDLLRGSVVFPSASLSLCHAYLSTNIPLCVS